MIQATKYEVKPPTVDVFQVTEENYVELGYMLRAETISRNHMRGDDGELPDVVYHTKDGHEYNLNFLDYVQHPYGNRKERATIFKRWDFEQTYRPYIKEQPEPVVNG